MTLIRWDQFPIILSKSLLETNSDGYVEMPVGANTTSWNTIQLVYEALYNNGYPVPKCIPTLYIDEVRAFVINYPDILLLRTRDIATINNHLSWCKENAKKGFSVDDRGFQFNDPEEAALFKLTLPKP